MTSEMYLNMQKTAYDKMAGKWQLNKKDPVVGSYDQHNNWIFMRTEK